MKASTDLFGVSPVQEPREPEDRAEADVLGSLPERVFTFFKDHKYQTFNMLELFPHFPKDHPTRLRRSVKKLWREGKLAATGETRGPDPIGIDHEVLTLNLHKPE